jgi:hypothetical protein
MAGRPRKLVDEKSILDLASKGRTLYEIAAYCGVSDDTLSRNYAEVIERGRQLMKGSLRSKQVEVAMRGNPQMLIWLGKQNLGQTDKSELTGSIKHEHIDLGHLTDEQLQQVRELISSSITSGGSMGREL